MIAPDHLHRATCEAFGALTSAFARVLGQEQAVTMAMHFHACIEADRRVRPDAVREAILVEAMRHLLKQIGAEGSTNAFLKFLAASYFGPQGKKH